MTLLLSIDIGSTYTKGACFSLSDEGLQLLGYARTATTVHHLKEGFDTVRRQLDQAKEIKNIHWSSSARGGLAIAAIGLVPELTLKIAKLAALSAGGKVASVYSYKLTRQNLDEMVAKRPDIILLAGGTDGGNEDYVRYNLGMLAQLPARMDQANLPSLIYAGNAVLQDEVKEALEKAGFEVHLAANLMPQMDQMNPEGAREHIREVFLRKIVHGKGLDEIVAEVGSEPLPTPLAVLQLVEGIRKRTDFGDFLLLDMGGATTDVYSSGESRVGDERVIKRGVREPIVKRSVEGDLGMRVSARVASHATQDTLAQLLEERGLDQEAYDAFVEKLMQFPDYLPTEQPELTFDELLASSCIHHGMVRHAGTWKRVFTASGETMLQTGKDLRGIRKVIGSGGYLSALPHFKPAPLPVEEGELIPLIPQNFIYYRDRQYLLPILGNLVSSYGEPVLRFALEGLEEMGEVGK